MKVWINSKGLTGLFSTNSLKVLSRFVKDFPLQFAFLVITETVQPHFTVGTNNTARLFPMYSHKERDVYQRLSNKKVLIQSLQICY